MKKLLITLLLSALPALAAWPNGYTYKYALTIQSGMVPATQANFPLLVCPNGTNGCNLTVAALAGEFTSSSCFDAVFTASPAGLNTDAKLPFELVPGSCTSASGIAEWWVSPSSVTAGMTIYMYVGNPSQTTNPGWPTAGSSPWDGNFQGVWHLPNGSSLNLNDSTANANNGTGSGSPTAAAGYVDGAMGLASASTQYADMGNSSTLNPAAVTVSAWVKGTSFPNAYNGVVTRMSDPGGYQLLVKSSGALAIYMHNGGGYCDYDGTGSHTLSAGTWYYLSATFNASLGLVGYINAAVDGSNNITGGAGLPSGNADHNLIGDIYGTLGDDFNGIIDEVRISSLARSATWVALEYNTMVSQAAFWSITGPTTNTNNITISPSTIAANSSNNTSLTLTGAGTSWVNGTTVFTPSGVSGVSVVSTTVTGSTAATVAVSTLGSGTGTLTLTESVTGSNTGTTAVAVAVPVISSVSIVANSAWSVKAAWTTSTPADSTIFCGPTSPFITYTSATVNPYAATADGSTWGVTAHAMASNPMPNGTGLGCYVKSCDSAGCTDTSASPVTINLAAPAASVPIAMLNTSFASRTRLSDRYAGQYGSPATGEYIDTDTSFGCWLSDGNNYWFLQGWGVGGASPATPAYPVYSTFGGSEQYVKFTDSGLTTGSVAASAWQNGVNNLLNNSYTIYTYGWSCIGINGMAYSAVTSGNTTPVIQVTEKSPDHFQTVLSTQHNVGPDTTSITAMSCSSGTVTVTSKLSITDEVSLTRSGMTVAIMIEGASYTGASVNGGPWGVTGTSGAIGATSTISFANPNGSAGSCTGWGTWSSGGTINVYGWDMPSSPITAGLGEYVPAFIQTDADDYQNGAPWAMDGFVYYWQFTGGANGLYLWRVRMEDFATQAFPTKQCFSGSQTDTAGLLNSNWGGTCTVMNPVQWNLIKCGRGTAAPITQFLTAQHRFVTAYEECGGTSAVPGGGGGDSNGAGTAIFDNGMFPWSAVSYIGLVPRTIDPYYFSVSGPQFPQWIASSQTAANGVTTINLMDSGGDSAGSTYSIGTNSYSMFVTAGLQFAESPDSGCGSRFVSWRDHCGDGPRVQLRYVVGGCESHPEFSPFGRSTEMGLSAHAHQSGFFQHDGSRIHRQVRVVHVYGVHRGFRDELIPHRVYFIRSIPYNSLHPGSHGAAYADRLLWALSRGAHHHSFFGRHRFAKGRRHSDHLAIREHLGCIVPRNRPRPCHDRRQFGRVCGGSAGQHIESSQRLHQRRNRCEPAPYRCAVSRSGRNVERHGTGIRRFEQFFLGHSVAIPAMEP